MTFARGYVAIIQGAWRASRWRLIAILAVTLLSYASWPLTPLVLKHVTDAVVAHDAGAATHAALFLPVLALLNAIGAHLLHVLFVEVADQNVVDLTGDLADLAHEPAGLAHLERPDYADEIELARNEGAWRYGAVSAAVTAIGVVVQLTLTVLLLARLQPILLLLLVLAVAPLVGTRVAWRGFWNVWRANADRMRRSNHYADLALRADAAKEVRLFGLEEEVRRRIHSSRQEVRDALFRADLKGVASQSVGFTIFALGYVAALYVVVRGAVRGHQTPGDVVLAVSLAGQTNRLVFAVVVALQRLQRSAVAADRVRRVRRLVAELYPPFPAPVAAPERLDRGISFENVAFGYPGSDDTVFSGIDLDLPAGSTVAFVGENGAGKSTLVKLLCRFYEPTAGRIAVDGADLAQIDPASWRQRIAVGFQDFVRFELIARESVGVGELPLVDDVAAVEGAVDRAAARDVVADLPLGLDTPLGVTQAGAELSGGQWQKLALARAMMRERPLLLVLDEPTSALDAHAEHELFERYAESARTVAKATGGIAIFVSHRFSTVRMADRIVVVEDGGVAEHGTHEELIARNGTYAELFALQAAAYG
ncbi:MAG TPA: ABC transporter ATP-binding protein [Gaiellaceae bacterium]|nr:ABC transporter ATP-binding protein [Gaiellaceae bacterium]